MLAKAYQTGSRRLPQKTRYVRVSRLHVSRFLWGGADAQENEKDLGSSGNFNQWNKEPVRFEFNTASGTCYKQMNSRHPQMEAPGCS